MEEGYEEIIDEAEDQYEDSQELQEGQLDQQYDDSGAYSAPKEKSDLYNWFWRIVQLGAPEYRDEEEDLAEEALRLSKVGNLSGEEVGKHTISVRDSMVLANLGDTFHHHKFADFWRKVGMIHVSTSMSKKGWLVEQSISQKKVRQRAKSSSTPIEKSRIFGKKKDKPDQ